MSNNIGDIVFISVTEEVWSQPFARKIHHDCEHRSVILRCKILEIKDDRFKAELINNNGFERW